MQSIKTFDLISGWYRGEKRAMRFAVPRIWREPTNHTDDCYFCMVDPSRRRTGKNTPPIVYPSIPSSIAPVPHSEGLPVPIPPLTKDQPSTDEFTADEEETDFAPTPLQEEKKALFSQSERYE